MKPSRPRRSPAPRVPAIFACWLGLLAVLSGQEPDNLSLFPSELPEPKSPNEASPRLSEPGLSDRAVPREVLEPPSSDPQAALYRLTRPFFGTLLSAPLATSIHAPDHSSFRAVTTYEPSTGLLPRPRRNGLLEFYLSFTLAQSFDSNVNLTANDQVADFFLTPALTLEMQLGSPDSSTAEYYDTIFALHATYDGSADLFYANPGFSAYNQSFQLAGRIGRSNAIWRPFLDFSDRTGSNLLSSDLVNRVRRIRLQAGIIGEYKFSDRIGFRQTFSGFLSEHPDPEYIDFRVIRTRQEASFLLLHSTRVLLWGEYRQTQPLRGSSATELLGGLGWQGKPDPRLYTELYLGWANLSLAGHSPGRSNLGGVRFNGSTTFEWSPRLKLTLIYDRDYVFSELTRNDNYISMLLQLKAQFYLGKDWYVTPYAGFSLDESESSHRRTLQMRPELEIARSFTTSDLPDQSRAYFKIGWGHALTTRGSGEPVSDFRASAGFRWMF